jgi:hypothetical protein
MESAIQLTLPLFDAPSFQDLLASSSLEDRLMVSVKPRLRSGWQVRIQGNGKKRHLLIPSDLASAPLHVKQALVTWAFLPYLPRRTQRQELRRKKKALERVVWDYARTIRKSQPRRSRFDPRALDAPTQGRVYDLREVFNTLNERCFSGRLLSFVRWGASRSRTSYHVVKTDDLGNHVNAITIAGVYNHPDVPRFAIEAIMHHEMLHIAIPPEKKDGRRIVHGKSFKMAEKKFNHFHAWHVWEKKVLPYLAKRKVPPN